MSNAFYIVGCDGVAPGPLDANNGAERWLVRLGKEMYNIDAHTIIIPPPANVRDLLEFAKELKKSHTFVSLHYLTQKYARQVLDKYKNALHKRMSAIWRSQEELESGRHSGLPSNLTLAELLEGMDSAMDIIRGS
jgi:hypothetical protein